MLILSFASVLLTLMVFPGGSPLARPLIDPASLLIAGIVALLATLAEAVSPLGLDNLLVPAVSALGLIIAMFIVGVAFPGWFTHGPLY
jgi:hypothetical protein